MGKFVVSPTTFATDCGRFRASFALKHARGDGSHCQVFSSDKTFASRNAARLFAVTQAWLQTCMLKPPSC
jgi:hypothetical protein